MAPPPLPFKDSKPDKSSRSPPRSTVRKTRDIRDRTSRRTTAPRKPATYKEPISPRPPSRTTLPMKTTAVTDGHSTASKSSTVDIMFAIDCTGSMGGEIEGVKNAVTEFAQIIETDGIDMRLGLIEYRDRLEGEEQVLCDFDDGVFTRMIPEFRERVSLLSASGGGDEPESTFDAILLAMRSIEDVGRTNALVVITDAPPKIPDMECSGVREVVTNIREMDLDQLYMVFPLDYSPCQVYYDLLSEITGEAFEIRDGGGGASGRDMFYQTLLELGRSITEYTRMG